MSHLKHYFCEVTTVDRCNQFKNIGVKFAMRPQHLKSKALQRRFAIWRWMEESLFNALMMKAVGVISRAEFLLALGLHSALVFSLGTAWDLFFLLRFVLNLFSLSSIFLMISTSHFVFAGWLVHIWLRLAQVNFQLTKLCFQRENQLVINILCKWICPSLVIIAGSSNQVISIYKMILYLCYRMWLLHSVFGYLWLFLCWKYKY